MRSTALTVLLKQTCKNMISPVQIFERDLNWTLHIVKINTEIKKVLKTKTWTMFGYTISDTIIFIQLQIAQSSDLNLCSLYSSHPFTHMYNL